MNYFNYFKNKNEIVQNDIQNLEQYKSKQSLMQSDTKNIKNAINILSQKEKLIQALEFQQKLKIEDEYFEKEILKKLAELEQMENGCKLKLQQFLNETQLFDLDILINMFNKEIQLNQLDSRIFIELIPQLQNEIFNAFKEMWKKTIDKGQLFIDYLKSIETNQKDQLEQEQQNIQKYQSTQTQFENQFTLLLQNQDKQNKILQTDQDLIINSQNLKLMSNKLKQDVTQVTQTTQTTTNLNICSKLFTTTKKIAKRSQFSTQQVKGIQFTYPIYINFNQPLKFSSTLKHSSITISACGKIAELPSGGHYLCLCDQAIHRNGTALVKFKMNPLIKNREFLTLLFNQHQFYLLYFLNNIQAHSCILILFNIKFFHISTQILNTKNYLMFWFTLKNNNSLFLGQPTVVAVLWEVFYFQLLMC